MMGGEPGIRGTLWAVIQRDLQAIAKMNAQLENLAGGLEASEPEYRDLAAIAYTLHNLYNALENSFEQISRSCENHVTDPAQWHKELLDKMFLEIPGVRPAVLREDTRRLLNDLRGFRHVFRHSYDFEIDPERLKPLVIRWREGSGEVVRGIECFAAQLLPTRE
jgi:uncharacterized protein YutE (UPF0331/DUF86 family)